MKLFSFIINELQLINQFQIKKKCASASAVHGGHPVSMTGRIQVSRPDQRIPFALVESFHGLNILMELFLFLKVILPFLVKWLRYECKKCILTLNIVARNLKSGGLNHFFHIFGSSHFSKSFRQSS